MFLLFDPDQLRLTQLFPFTRRYYINAMQMFDMTGPYRIAGYSYGSTIAFEMAHQLQANKKEVTPISC